MAAAGALVMASGTVMLNAPAASAAGRAYVGICHFSNHDYTYATVDGNSIDGPTGHDGHANDVIPAFGSYQGKNTYLTALIQENVSNPRQGSCGTLVAIPTKPVPTAPTCTAAGSFSLPGDTTSLDWSISPQYEGAGDYTVTVATKTGYVFSDGTTTHSWPITVAPVKTTTECGSHTSTPPGTPGGSEVPPPSSTGGGGTPGSDNAGDVVTVTPRYPTTTPATCEKAGSLVVPTQPQGVLVKQTGSVPGDVTFTFSTAKGYTFPAATQTTVTVTVAAKKTSSSCGQVLGVETTGSKSSSTGSKVLPNKVVVVGASPVAVPTAVDAGLATMPSVTGSATNGLLAQGLVGGGLLLVMTGGWIGLGRRTRGAREF